jgi:tetratricopeptide (TPR) repeat protein
MPSFIAELKTRLAENDWPVVVASLRSDAQVWTALQGEFGAPALEAAASKRERWSPAFLGLLSLGQAAQFEMLRSAPLQGASEKLRYEAAAAFEELASQPFDPDHALPDLSQATLLALALRERRRLLNGWEELANDLSIASAEFWKLPVAALFGMLPNQHELLAELLNPNKSDDLHVLGLHALVSNPLSPDVQATHLLEIIQTYELPKFLTLLRALAGMNAQLARQAAMQALENIGDSQAEQEGLARIQRLLLQAEIYQISGQTEQAVPVLNSAWEASQRLQADLAVKLAETNGDDGDISALQESAELADPKTASAIKAANKRPAALYSAARVAFKSGDLGEAKVMSVAALQAAAQDARPEESQQRAALLRDLGDLFIQLQLPQESEMAAKAALELQANDPASASLLSEVMLANGKFSEALDHAHLAAALSPENTGLRRNLAKALQRNGQGQEAFAEWQAVLDLETQSNVEDLLAYAQVALDSEHIEEAMKACQETLALHPTNGAAYMILGLTLQAQGDETSAIQYLRRATELSPTQTAAWLSLAEMLAKKEGPQAAADALSSAQSYIAPSAKLQVMLAENYVRLNRSEEALPIFQRAGQLAAEQADSATGQNVALNLAQLHVAQGNQQSALRTLDEAQQAYPGSPRIATLFGKLLLDSNEPRRALAALKLAYETQPEAGLLLDIARAQLAAGDMAAEAEASLTTLIAEIGPSIEIQSLLASAMAAQSKHTEAIKIFDAALKDTSAKDVATRKTLVLGKAASHAASGKPVAALQTLEAFDKQTPGDLDVLRALCGAYKQAGHADEAAEIANKVYAQNNSSETALLWYADQMHALGKSSDACKLLGAEAKSGAKSAQASAPLALSLGKLQWDGESHEVAIETLNSLFDLVDSEAVTNAANFLLGEGAAKESIDFFKRAIAIVGDGLELWSNLTNALMQVQDWAAALDASEKVISLAPHRPQAHELRADILMKLDRPQAALGSLEQAIEMLPSDAHLHARKAQLLRDAGDWAAAFEAASRAFELDSTHPAYLQSAAEIAVMGLHNDKARAVFSRAKLAGAPGFELACLQAELALEAGEEVQAANAVAIASEHYHSHPRLMALQSQLAACRGDRTEAESLLQRSAQEQQKTDITDLLTLNGIASAAERINDWSVALDLRRAMAKAYPGNVLAQFSLGRALVLRAEWQFLCEIAKATHGLPGADAYGKQAREQAARAFTSAGAIAYDGAQATVAGWAVRGDLRFGATLDLDTIPASYPQSAGEAAALYSAFKGSKDAGKRIKSYINSPEVLVLRALETSDATEAQDLVAAAAKQLSGSAPVFAVAAGIASKAGDANAALVYIQRALALWSVQPAWQSLAGELQRTLGNLDEASQHFAKAAELEPKQVEHYFALGQVQVANKSLTEGVESLQKAAAAAPKRSEYLLALAQAQRLAGNTGEAKARAQQAHKAAPNNADALVLQAELALEAGDAAGAKGIIEQALALAPQAANALRVFAEALHALGQNEDAIAVIERARETVEDEVELMIRRAQMLAGEQGLSALIKLSQRYTDRGEVFFALSQMLAEAGNIRDAISAAQRAAKLAVSAGGEILANIHQHLGKLLKQDGNLDQSLHHLEQAISLAPHLVESHIERGRVFLARRQQGKALEAFRQAAASAPQDATPHVEAALALKEAKDYDAAERELRTAAKLSPRDRTIQRQLAAVIALNIVHQPHAAGVAQ